MANEVRPKYRCTEQELYSISQTGWGNCKIYLTDFKNHKAFYTEPYVDAKIALITAAKVLPNDEERSGVHELYRIQLEEAGENCLQNFRKLESYIKSAYPKSEVKTRSDVAGKTLYATAANQDWEDMSGLNEAMQGFITAQNATLSLNDNMPGSFPAKVDADALVFSDIYTLFKNSMQTETGRADKILANNSVYDDLLTMFADGIVIFDKNFEKQQLFTFKAIKDIVSPPGSASLKITVLLAGSNFPVENAALSMSTNGGQPISGTSDADGVILIQNIDPGVYTGTITFTGFNVVSFTKEVNTGTSARLEVKMVGE